MFYKSPEVVILIYIACFIVVVLSIGLILYFITGLQKRQFEHLRSVEELKRNQQIELMQAQLEIQEQTFANISRDIHDNIGQKLTLAKLHLNTLSSFQNQLGDSRITVSITLIGEVIADLSDLSRSMSSEILLQNGLIKAIEFEAAQLAKTGLFKINSRVTGEPKFLPEETELVIFRIIQEGVNNIIKHSGATEVFIGLHFLPERLRVQVQDNGKGFDRSKVNGSGIGLVNMENRAKLISASLNFISRPGEGTKIELEIPNYGTVTQD